jgi:DNA-directed RNA polymerase subunit omega
MNNPPVSALLDKVDARYTLIAIAAKRARQFIHNSAKSGEVCKNPVTTALFEIANGSITWERVNESLKWDSGDKDV